MMPTPPSSPPPPVPPPFRAALGAALEIAALSPSSHNCQPWGVARLRSEGARRAAAAFLDGAPGSGESYAGTGPGTGGGPYGDMDGVGAARTEYLALALDRERRLESLPAHADEMRLSCGLYWRVLLRALAAQGWALQRIRFHDHHEHHDHPLPGHPDTPA
ncbi:hypothetical protein ACSNOD_25925, partial [Streptomyces sp. URMC 123]